MNFETKNNEILGKTLKLMDNNDPEGRQRIFHSRFHPKISTTKYTKKGVVF